MFHEWGFSLLFSFTDLLYVCVLSVCTSVHHMHASVPEGRQKRVVHPHELELQTLSCEGLCRCWELNLGPLEEQLVS